MPKMKLKTTAERFFKHRLAIAAWLVENHVAVEIHFWPASQKACLLFDKTADAQRLVEQVEGL
ncbi:hypothetical protein [Caballeronia temeraria]|uniref:hypothetical protein n=1 Tax=Caballeronia temeraria TaxID=1777137 RepID=UPI0007723E0F|nr:hypothetical protein [Caballeronia temeraria]